MAETDKRTESLSDAELRALLLSLCDAAQSTGVSVTLPPHLLRELVTMAFGGES